MPSADSISIREKAKNGRSSFLSTPTHTHRAVKVRRGQERKRVRAEARLSFLSPPSAGEAGASQKEIAKRRSKVLFRHACGESACPDCGARCML